MTLTDPAIPPTTLSAFFGHAVPPPTLSEELRDFFRAALAGGALSLHLQPQHAASGVLVGAEALLRWNDGGETLSPEIVLEAAKLTGLEELLHTSVVQASLALLSRMADTPFPGPLSINLPLSFLAREELVERICDDLSAYGLSPSMLCIEITETEDNATIAAAALNISRLQALGFSFSLDDFGVAHSNYERLQRLDLDEIKLDRSLIAGLADPAMRDKTVLIVRHALALAEDLGLSVVAEGVEAAAQAEQLAAFGCPVFQGFYYSKPLSEQDFFMTYLPALSQGAGTDSPAPGAIHRK